MTDGACPFCSPGADRIFYRDSLVIGLWDSFPVTPGHALLIPTRHVPTWFEASHEERIALMRAIDAARLAIESNFGADGYNIGINNGEVAGQTVLHLHVHVIPRRRGDMSDPRGGVRHVIPEKGNYIRDAAPVAIDVSDYTTSYRALFTGGTDDPLLRQLKHHLALSQAADMAIAFTLRSGLQLIQIPSIPVTAQYHLVLCSWLHPRRTSCSDLTHTALESGMAATCVASPVVTRAISEVR